MALTLFAEGPASLDPQKALYIPVGAASAGVAYWWMTRWADRANLEALLGPFPAVTLPAPAADAVPPEPLAAVAEASVVAGAMVEQALQASADVTAAMIEAVAPAEAPSPIADPLPEPIVEPVPEPLAKPRAKVPPASDPTPDA